MFNKPIFDKPIFCQCGSKDIAFNMKREMICNQCDKHGPGELMEVKSQGSWDRAIKRWNDMRNKEIKKKELSRLNLSPELRADIAKLRRLKKTNESENNG